MPGKLTWNGIPLCIPDPDGELERWLAQFQRIDELIAFCGTETAQISSNNAPRSNAGTGITTPNYPDLPPLKINQLVWPTGATRFGYFVGFVPAGLSEVGTLGSTGSLILSDGTSGTTASMQLLAYRPVSSAGTSPLWMIVLVDRRYSWQFKNAGNIITASGYPMLDDDGTYDGTPNNDYGQLQISYAEVFAAIETAIGATIIKSSVSGFLVPDVLELSNRKYFNVAQLLEAVTQSCGLRVWLDFNGSVRAQNSSISYTANFDDLTNIVAGGLSGSATPKPSSVTVNFRRASQYHAYADNDVYPIAIPSSGAAGVSLVVESCAYANWLSVPDNYVNAPDNAANISSLASNIASGALGWYATPYDATFAGVKPWTPSGFDNLITITYAQQVPNDAANVPAITAMEPQDGERFDIDYYRFTTRAQSMPANFGSYINLSQDPSIRFLRGMQWGKLTEASKQPIDDTTPQPVSVSIWQLDSTFAEHNTGITIQAYDVSLSTDPLPEGARVYLWFHEVNRMWILERMADESAIVRVTGTSAVANSSQKNAVCLWPGNVVTYNTDYPGCSGGQYQPKQDIWLAVINNDGEVVNYLPTGDRYLGKPVGTYAVGDDSRPLYVIRADHRLVRFQLIQPMICGQPSPGGNAVQLYWSDATDQYALSSQIITVVDPYVDDGGMFEGFPQTSYQLGYRGVAEWKPDRQVYEIVFMQRPAQWIKFFITDDKLGIETPSVRAQVRSFWGGKNPDPQRLGITVYQQFDATSRGFFFGVLNCAGLAVYNDYANRYEIVYLESLPTFVAGVLTSDLLEGEATFRPTDGWDNKGFLGYVNIPTAMRKVLDKSSIFTGATGRKIQATFSARDEAYVLTWVECPAE